jgi:preprotein translocase subunit SecG
MWLTRVLTGVQLASAAAIVFLVLLQRGKGAEAGAGFGAGASGTVFGARGATTALSRATAIFAAIFMLNSLFLAYLATRPSTDAPRTLLDEAAQKPASLPGSGSNVPPAPAPAPASAPAGAPATAAAPVPVPAAPAPAPVPTPAPK